MEDLKISYTPKGYFNLALAGYGILLSLYLCINEIVINNYKFMFFAGLILFILSLTVILTLTALKPKPLIEINNVAITSHIPGQTPLYIDWKDIKEVTIGISSVTFISHNAKSNYIDLKTLKYKDLKDLKGKIIELCEYKNIPFSND